MLNKPDIHQPKVGHDMQACSLLFVTLNLFRDPGF